MPAFCTINGLNVLDGLIYIPRIGVWHADLNVDSFTTLTGQAATIQLPSQTLKGTVTRSGTDVAKRLRTRVIGGAAGLATVLPPRSYGAVQLQIPLKDALTGAGETLSPAADPSVLAWPLTAWSRMAVPASYVLAQLVALVPNAVWRVLIDGTVWVGFETWPPASLPDTVPIHSEPEKGRITIASDAPAVLPGTAFSYLSPGVGKLTRNVSYVRHAIRPDQLRTIVSYE